MDLIQFIRDIKDFPEKGVVFRDITPLLEHKEAFRKVVNNLGRPYSQEKVDKVVGIDARGFLLAAPVAYKLNCGLSIVRKKGKLPCKTISEAYSLEYAQNVIEMHKDTILPGEKVVIVDDVLATGGTMLATVNLIEKLGGKIAGISFLINLKYLAGEEKLKNYNIHSLINYS